MKIEDKYIRLAEKEASNAAFAFLPKSSERPTSIDALSYCATKFIQYLQQDIAMRLTGGNVVDAFQLQFPLQKRFVRAFLKATNAEAERIGLRVCFVDVTFPGGAIKLQAKFEDEK